MNLDKKQLVAIMMRMQEENQQLQKIVQRTEETSKENDILKKSIATFRNEFQKRVCSRLLGFSIFNKKIFFFSGKKKGKWTSTEKQRCNS